MKNKNYIRTNLIIYCGVPILWALTLFYCFNAPLALLKQYWYIPLAAFGAAGFANITAVGGGFIFIPLVVICLNMNPLIALKLSLSSEAFGMTTGAYTWFKEKKILFAIVYPAVVFSSFGMTIGTFMITPDSFYIKVIFAFVSISIGILTFLMRKRIGDKDEIDSIHKIYYIVFFIGGLLTAWISIGIGEIIVFLLLKYNNIESKMAIGTGVAVLSYNAILGFLFHLFLGNIPFHILIFTVPGVIMGSRTFVLFANRELTRTTLTWIFIMIAIIDGGAILLKMFLK